MNNLKTILFVAFTAALMCSGMLSSANLITITQWDVASNSGTAGVVDVLDTALGVTATEITAHGVHVLSDSRPEYQGVFVANGWSLTESLDPDKYYEFAITDPGRAYALNSIELSLSRGAYGLGEGASKWAFYANDRAFGELDLDNIDGQGTAALEDQPVIWTIDLSGLTAVDSYVFRLYGYSDFRGTDYAGLNESWYDNAGTNVRLYGYESTVIPEPAALSLFMLGGGLTFCGFFKRRKKE